MLNVGTGFRFACSSTAIYDDSQPLDILGKQEFHFSVGSNQQNNLEAASEAASNVAGATPGVAHRICCNQPIKSNQSTNQSTLPSTAEMPNVETLLSILPPPNAMLAQCNVCVCVHIACVGVCSRTAVQLRRVAWLSLATCA